MNVERVTSLLTATCVLLASTSVAGQQREPTAETRVLQGCVIQSNGTTRESSAVFWLDTAPDAGQPDDRSVNSGGQSRQTAGQQQMPTGQQTQAGQQPMAAVMDEDAPTGPRPGTYRLVTADERVALSSHVGQRVEVEGTVSIGSLTHRRHDGRAEPQGIGGPMTGLPGPPDQTGQPGPHNTSPDDRREVAGTMTVTAVRVLAPSCTTGR